MSHDLIAMPPQHHLHTVNIYVCMQESRKVSTVSLYMFLNAIHQRWSDRIHPNYADVALSTFMRVSPRTWMDTHCREDAVTLLGIRGQAGAKP